MRHLPPGGAVARAEGSWAESLEVQVAILEQLDVIARLIYGQSGKRPPGKPLHVTRPGEVERTPPSTPDRMTALLEAAEARG